MNPAVIAEFEAGPAKVRAAVAGLTREELTARPGPGDWSILEVVVHLSDSDVIAVDRIKRMLIEDNPPLLYADENAYITKLFPHDQDLDDAIVLMEVGRRQLARVLRKLPPEAFDRTGTNNKTGLKTVGGMVQSYIKHVDDHLKYVHAKREKLGKPLK